MKAHMTSTNGPILLLFGAEHADLAVRILTVRPNALVVLEERGLRTRMLMLVRRLKRMGATRVAGQLMRRMALRAASATGTGDEGAVSLPAALRVRNINDASVISFVANHSPSACYVYGTSLLRRRLLRALPASTANMHTGLTQHYRGVCSNFWAVHDGQLESIGYTIHRIASGIDTGDVIEQAILGHRIVPAIASLEELDDAVAAIAETAFVDFILSDGALRSGTPLVQNGQLRTEPTYSEWLEGRARLKELQDRLRHDK